MKKSLFLAGIICVIIVLSGCGESKEETANENKLPNPIEDPASYVPGMMDVNKNAQNSLQDSINKENDKINNALNENNMDSKQTLVAPDSNSPLLKKYTAAKISTSLGDIKVKLDGSNAPLASANFLNLAQNKFYDGTKFHRVIKGFMIQGGDPLSKNENMKERWGTGGPGYSFKDELKGTEKYPQGTLAMANSGPNTNGSQFFIVTASPEAPLPPSYTVFGQVVEGMDVALKIENVQTGANDRPIENVTIKSIGILEK